MMTTLLNNRYQIIQVLGAGGFGETFLAEDTYMPSRRPCVIKQLKPVTNDPQMYQLIQQRFQREAATLEALGEGSDQIPKLYAYFLENGQFHLVQEWIQGQTLTDKVATEGPLSESAVRKILASLLLVLDYVHSKGIIYRDIKPDNIIVRGNKAASDRVPCQSNGQPVLIDFGAVKETMTAVVNSQGKATYSIVLGTPGFMSPEQATGRPIYASDLYSLGMTAIYLLTGLLPQELEVDPKTEEVAWRQHAPNVSSHLAAVLEQAIQYHPRDRYTTAIKMLDALEAAIPPQPASTQATIVVSTGEKPFNQTAPLSPQPVLVSNTSSQGKQQKALLLGSLLVGSLLSAVVVGVRQQQSLLTTSLQPQSRSEPIATTPAAIEPPTPASNPVDVPVTVVTASPSPQLESTPEQEKQHSEAEEVKAQEEQENKQQITQAASPVIESAQRQKNENQNSSTTDTVSNTIPSFPTGIAESRIKATLGNPTRTSNGYHFNTRALLYELKSNQVSLGYLVDRSSGRLRQTEVSFAQSIDPSVMQATLKGILGDGFADAKDNRTLVNVSQGLQKVYDRRTNRHSFNVDGLEGVIERNNSDRIYIGVWDADLH